MKCTRCGFNNYDGMKICKNCGATLNNSLLNQQQTNYNNYNGYNTNSMPNNGYNIYNTNNINNNGYNTYNNQPNINNLQYQPIKEDYNKIKVYKEKKPIGKFLAVTALVLFMTALLIGVVYLYLENHGIIGDKKQTSTNQIQETIEDENEEISNDSQNNEEEVSLDNDNDNDNDNNNENENETETSQTPTPTQESTPVPTEEPTPIETIDENSFFGKVENLDNFKLIGSKTVGYMIAPYDVNIQKMESDSIAYSNSNNSAMIYIAAYKQEDMTLQEQSLVVIESIENGQYFAQDIRTNGGVISDCEYINIRATYPNEKLYLNGYLVKFNNDEENTYRWIEIKYTIENLNDYANLFNNYTIKITDEVPSSLYNESDHF